MSENGIERSVDPDDLRSLAESFTALADEIEKQRRLEEEATAPCAVCGDPTEIAVQKTLGGVNVGDAIPYCAAHRPEEGIYAI